MTASVTASPEGLIVKTPYSPTFVAALKAQVPAAGRAWDPSSKVWVIAHNYAPSLQALLRQYYPGVRVPAGSVAAAVREIRLLDVRYVGATKDRGDDTRTAFGYCNGGWTVILPESELRRWFGADANMDGRVGREATLYQVLSVTRDANADDIKRSYRRLARQWHPDVCKEPDAKEQFQRLQAAYEALSNPAKRARYDAGLTLMMTASNQDNRMYAADGYRPPLRCGYILAEGYEQLGRFLVSKILAWEDITQGGKTLVTSWPAGATMFVEAWT